MKSELSAGPAADISSSGNVEPLTPHFEMVGPALIDFSELREELYRAELFRLDQRAIHHRIQGYLDELRIEEWLRDRERGQALLDRHLAQRHAVPQSLLERQTQRELLGKMGL